MKRVLALAAAVAMLGLGAWQVGWDAGALQAWIERNPVLGASAYVMLVAGSVVLLPFSSLPLLPVATRGYGVAVAALLSAAGWWLGALVAFEIARLGRRWLERWVSMQALDRAEARIPGDIGFGGIVLLRMLLPVDIVSFALGLLKRLSFATYAVASLVGILPFSFAWSYAGGELGAGRFASFALVVAAILLAALAGRRLWKRRRD